MAVMYVYTDTSRTYTSLMGRNIATTYRTTIRAGATIVSVTTLLS